MDLSTLNDCVSPMSFASPMDCGSSISLGSFMYFDCLTGFDSPRFCAILLCVANPRGYASSMLWV